VARVLDLKAGERKRVLWIMSSSIPGTVRFRAETDDGSPPGGTVELARRRWFSWYRSEHDLAARNVFEKGFSDADYRVYVTPVQDCRIVFETRHFQARHLVLAFAVVAMLGIAAAIGSILFANSG